MMQATTGEAPRSVAVFRALMLGDMLCATPALRALRLGWPDARITLIGLPWAREFAARLPAIDRFEVFCGWPGFDESPLPSARAAAAFLMRQRERGDDLALQMHGSGESSNPLVAAFGAARCAGFASRNSWVPARHQAHFVPWPERGREVERLLTLIDRIGVPRHGTELDFPLDDGDREAAQALVPARRYAIVHPGAQWRSRRWPVERFAAVADALAAAGLEVAVTGTTNEAGLAAALVAAMRARAVDLSGRTNLGTLGALVERAALVVCNDTGLSHVAAALRTPSVVIASGSDVERWAPQDRALHRVLWRDVPCRPCTHRVCPLDEHACALGVTAGDVKDAAFAQLERQCAR